MNENKYIINKLIIALAIISFERNINALYPDNISSWEIAEDLFITKPKSVANSLSGRLKKIGIAAVATSIPAYILYNKLSPNNTAPVRPLVRTAWRVRDKVIIGVTTPISFILIYYLTDYFILKNEECVQFNNVMANWSKYKNILPKGLHSIIEPFLNKSTNPEDSNTILNKEEAIRRIKLSVYKQFPNKYQEESKRDFFDSRHFLATLNADIGRILSGIADIIKAISRRRR